MLRVSAACAHSSMEYRHRGSQNLDRKKEGDRRPSLRRGNRLGTAKLVKKLLRRPEFEEV